MTESKLRFLPSNYQDGSDGCVPFGRRLFISKISIIAASGKARFSPGASQFLFDVGPPLATCRVERHRRHAASGGPTRTKQAMTKKPRCARSRQIYFLTLTTQPIRTLVWDNLRDMMQTPKSSFSYLCRQSAGTRASHVQPVCPGAVIQG